jgi:FSR family fosmidomycin resistance protein-like MFS transporter
MENTFKAENTAAEAPAHMGKVVSVALSHMFHDTFSTMISTLLPVFIDKFQISTLMAGVMPVFVRAPSVFQPFFGRLADKRDVRWILILWPSVTALFMTLTGIINNYVAVLVLLLLTGFSAAIFHTVAGPAAGKFAGNSIGRAMGLWMIGARIGAAVSPMVVVFTIELVSLEGLPVLIVLGLLSSLLLYTQFGQQPLHLSSTTEAAPMKDCWKIVKPVMQPLLVISLIQSFLGILYTTYLPTFMTQNGSPLWIAGLSMTLFSAAGIPASYLGGDLSDRIGRKQIFIFSAIATVALNFGFLFVSGWGSIVFAVLIGFTSFLVNPLPMAYVQTEFPQMRSYANGMYVGITFFLRSFAMLVVGWLADLYGMRILYIVFAFVFLLSLPIIIRLPERREPVAS